MWAPSLDELGQRPDLKLRREARTQLAEDLHVIAAVMRFPARNDAVARLPLDAVAAGRGGARAVQAHSDRVREAPLREGRHDRRAAHDRHPPAHVLAQGGQEAGRGLPRVAHAR